MKIWQEHKITEQNQPLKLAFLDFQFSNDCTHLLLALADLAINAISKFLVEKLNKLR